MSKSNILDFVKLIEANDELRRQVSEYEFTDYISSNQFIIALGAKYGFKLAVEDVICLGSKFSQQLAKGSEMRPDRRPLAEALASVFPHEYHLWYLFDRAIRDTYQPKWWQLGKRIKRAWDEA